MQKKKILFHQDNKPEKNAPVQEIFGFNEEVIAETEAYFESKDESFYKKTTQVREALK